MLDGVWSLSLDRTGPSWAWFDVARYGRNDAAAARAARHSPEAALEDYELRGAALGYAPNLFFDHAYYLATTPGLVDMIGAGTFRSSFEHYRLMGWHDRSPHWLFSMDRYRARYPDLSSDAVHEMGGLYGHYLHRGAAEHRTAHLLFDPEWYVGHVAPGQRDEAAAHPFEHFLAAVEAARVEGMGPEPQASPYFDPTWYSSTYHDVAAPGHGREAHGALHHYITAGMAEGRDPMCDFSESEYRAGNPDVAAAVGRGEFVCGYDHFLNFGQDGSRSPSSGVDLAWYRLQPGVARDLAAGLAANPFLHMLEIGIPKGLPLKPVDDTIMPAEAEARAAFQAQARAALPTLGRHPLQFGFTGVPDVSVLVILRNQFALTMQSLASLRTSFAGRIQLIIVDNASSDGTADIADLVHGAVLLRQETNLGFLRACNLALAHATADAVLYLNNDIILQPGAVQLSLARLAADPAVGAVGGKVIRTHGRLQEAGSLLWRSGNADGWMRDAAPDAPEANYVRDVDFCSGVFLMVRGSLLRQLGGFDEAYLPAYYEEVDLCLRIAAAGFRVVYDPSVVMVHYEYGSSRSARASTALMQANRSVLRTRHAAALRTRQADRGRIAEAAAHASAGRRVLFIEDTIPLRRLGQGYPRAAEAVNGLAEAGWQVTVFPMQPVRTPVHHITAAVPETVEALWDRDITDLPGFLQERRGYYDLVWVSRAHNLRQLLDIINRGGHSLEGAKLVLDTEAVFSLRDAARAELDGLPFNLAGALAQEFEGAWLCDHIAAISEAEAQVLRGLNLSSVSVLNQPAWGNSGDPVLTPAGFAERRGLLHVGALLTEDAPNTEGLRWYLAEIYPKLRALVGEQDATLTVAGFVSAELDLSWVRDHPGVNFMGPVTHLAPLFATHRAFVAPTRFGAGLPTKVMEAAGFGVPVACTDLLTRQMSWEHGRQVLSAPIDRPEVFARNVAKLLTDKKVWARVRAGAHAAVEAEFSPRHFREQLAHAVAATGVAVPRRRG